MNALESMGARPTKQVRYAPLFINRFFTGIWTNRNPLRDAATPYLYEKFYSGARFDSIIDGSNVEITPRLTIAKRPGISLLSGAGAVGAVDNFGSFRYLVSGAEQVKVLASTTGTFPTTSAVYSLLDPGTPIIYNKQAGDGMVVFQGIAGTQANGSDSFLYMGAGAHTIKWSPVADGAGLQLTTWGTPSLLSTTPSLTIGAAGTQRWINGTVYNTYNAILDTNGNIQVIGASGGGGGSSGSTYPIFNAQLGGTTADGALTWTCCGPYVASSSNGLSGIPGWKSSTAYNIWNCILDGNGNVQVVESVSGDSTTGSTIPVWASAGLTTTDNNVVWRNYGQGRILAFTGYQYVYCTHTSAGFIIGSPFSANFSSASNIAPGSAYPSNSTGPILGSGAYNAFVDGANPTDPDTKEVAVFRTTDGGSTFLFAGFAALNSHGAGNWRFTDNLTDAQLNELVQAPGTGAFPNYNDPPPAALTNIVFHSGRMFGSVGNSVYWSRETNQAVPGNSLEGFPSANVITLPYVPKRMFPCNLGLLVLTDNSVYLIQGTGTSVNPFSASLYIQGYGILNYHAFDVNGSLIYLYTIDNQVISLDPNTGISEISFPIGDKIGGSSTFQAATACVAWHSFNQDKGLYICDRSTGWYRMSASLAPESGICWSPFASVNISAGIGVIQRVETAPGVNTLLIGTNDIPTGVVYKRDTSVYTDGGGSPYSAFFTIGNLVLANPGQLAELAFITTDAPETINGATASRVSTSVLIDEISGSFTSLSINASDPTQLVSPSTLFSDRWYFSAVTLPALGRHLQIKFSWASVAFPAELYSYSIYGAIWQEK